MMEARASRLLELLGKKQLRLTDCMKRGLEKEGLRATPEGRISQADHPRALGCTLTHPWVTTDYSEALLELITPVCDSSAEALEWLEDLHRFVGMGLADDEVLWNNSMPCRLEGAGSVRIAEYGSSNLGRLKHVYRKGLEVRYGRIMQSIAGLHYNWSLTEDFWEVFAESQDSALQLRDFRSTEYFGLIRNFRRWSWLLMLLYGSSPAFDRSFLQGGADGFETLGQDTLFSPYATSLRMGDMGYKNDAQSGLFVCFNHLATYISTLYKATHTPHGPYEKLGIRNEEGYFQLNTNVLQIENEYYNNIRPKRVARPGEKPLQALHRDGVEYIEVRCLDINPFAPAGIDREQMAFMDLFLMHCLLTPSPLLNEVECRTVDVNFNRVVGQGRQPELRLERREGERTFDQSPQDWALEILDAMQPLAGQLDAESREVCYSEALAGVRERVSDFSRLPSQRVLDALSSGRSFVEWGLQGSQASAKQLASGNMLAERAERFAESVPVSWQAEAALRASDKTGFDEYLAAYMTA